MVEPGLVKSFAIACRIVIGDYNEVLSIRQVNGNLIENRTSHDVIRRTWIHRVETHRASYIPSGESLVIHSRVSDPIFIASVKRTQDPSNQFLRFPGSARIIVVEWRLPIGLTAQAILADHAGAVTANALVIVRRGENPSNFLTNASRPPGRRSAPARRVEPATASTNRWLVGVTGDAI
jgi:hypothetical protein